MPVFVGAGTSSFMKGSDGVGFSRLTTTQIGNLSGMVSGQVVYNTTKNVLQFYNGSDWADISEIKVAATGGNTITTANGFKIHKFTSPGTFTVTAGETTDAKYLIVAGGGGGGGDNSGGGGAGALHYKENVTLAPGAFPISIGGGGNGSPSTNQLASDGGNTVVGGTINITADGGGKGGTGNGGMYNGGPGGSGGGAAGERGATPSAIGPGTGDSGHPGGLDVQSPPNGWGNNGGVNSPGGGGGGGGARSVGQNAQSGTIGGNGGNGAQYSISGSNVYYAGGGGAGNENNVPSPSPTGGQGGGGNMNYSQPNKPAATNGDDNTGGGGGGGTHNASGVTGGNGGSGIVIIAYPA